MGRRRDADWSEFEAAAEAVTGTMPGAGENESTRAEGAEAGDKGVWEVTASAGDEVGPGEEAGVETAEDAPNDDSRDWSLGLLST